MKNFKFLNLLFVMGILFVSCNLSDFDLSKFADPAGLNPVVYRPMTSGTYVVKDYYKGAPLVGNTPVTADPIYLKLILYPFNGMFFNTNGIDSMVVIVKTVNEIPMKYQYKLIFTGPGYKDSTMVSSTIRNSATINTQGFVDVPSKDSLEFKLDSLDVVKLGLATEIDLSIALYQPGTGTVLANVLKSAPISFYIGFRAPLNLFKVKI
ncbi:MAG: hypothetical protein WCI31_11000 [Prolixibacteraceae bacterium]